MTAAVEQSESLGVLRRLIAAREQAMSDGDRPPQFPQPVVQTPTRAAATAVGRAAERLYQLGVQPISIDIGALTQAEITEVLPDPALLAMVQGPGESVGVMALCPETVTALIEIQALGRVTARPAERRRLTRSDALLCVDFVNGMLTELATEMMGVEGSEDFAGYRYATHLDDPRPLALMLEEKPYRSLDFRLRLGGNDGREARIFMALPHVHGSSLPSQPAPRGETAGRASAIDTRSAPQHAGVLMDAMQEAPIELIGVLCRRQVSLKDLRGLEPGKILPLPRVNIAAARLETTDGQLLATGKFGEAEGCHAIRLGRDTTTTAEPVQPAPVTPTTEPLPHDAFGPDEFRNDATPGSEIVETQPQTVPKAVSNG